MEKLSNFEGKHDGNNETVKNLIADLDNNRWDEKGKIISDFDKFENVKMKLIEKLNSERLIGNTLSDLGNFIGQVLYEYIDDNNDSFSVDDFIGGFEHGLDSMKEPSQSKYHNF